VRPAPKQIARGQTSSADSGPLQDRPAPPPGGDPSPVALSSTRRAWNPSDLRSLEVRGKRRVSEEIACSSEVSCLVATSRLWSRPRSGLIVSPAGRAPVSGHPSNLWT
jgi:hypothetical protein